MICRKDGESFSQYHKRLLQAKLVDKTLIIDYTDLAELIYGRRYSADVARRMAYGSIKTLAAIENDSISEVTDANLVAELRKERMALAEERVKFQTEKLEYSRWFRADVRDLMFEEKVLDAIKEHSVHVQPPENIVPVHSKREGVLCIADMHFGKEYKIYGLDNEVINEYSPEIFFDRMEAIYNTTIEKIKKENFDSIKIFNLGDSVEGFIRHSQIWTLRYGVIDSAIMFGNYIATWLHRLSEHVNIVYAQTDGNHDEIRSLDGKKGQHLADSAGKIITNIIKVVNRENPNLAIIENKTGLIYDNVCGYDILGIHGEVKDLTSALKEYSDIYHKDISYIIAGHKHHSDFKNCGVRKGCIGIGSIVGSDSFSMNIRRSADATASFLIFEEGKGKVEEHTYILN